jgi:succinate dehydrogenase/fumarate reductase flavoprotein subunit
MQVLNSLNQLPTDATFDLVVVGAGGAGMATALFAALDGKQVLLVERTEFVGGTTAWSAGTTWVPGTHHAAKVNPGDTLAEAARYLTNALGERTPAALRQAFLDHGAAAIRQIEERSEVKFRPYAKHPDYISDLGGSTLAGRALEPVPFDGRLLGDLFKLVRPPIPEFTVLGGMMVDRTDINHLLALTTSFASFRHSLSIILRHGLDRLSHPRGTRLVMGNALVARLLYSLSKQTQVTLALNTSVERFERDASGVRGVVLKGQGGSRSVTARGGVVLASGGFNRDPERRAKLLPGADIAWCPGAPGHQAQAHPLAERIGAVYGRGAGEAPLSHAFWAPVSLRQRADGSTAAFPHFVFDRAKPGTISVDSEGKRFLNESTSYHLYGLTMQGQLPGPDQGTRKAVPAYLITDAEGLRKYGLGMVRPKGMGLAAALADGYVTRADSIAELARKLGLPEQTLVQTIERFNGHWQGGTDPDFGRGSTAYQRANGDATWHGPNPSLGPIERAPFYAVKLYPGDIGASTGFATDECARVLDAQGAPIGGLYAAGNDMQSVMGGIYPAPGITLGPGLVFAYIAAKDALARRSGMNRPIDASQSPAVSAMTA